MNLNLTLVGQAISFAIFVWFCMKYVWPPLIGALHERQDKIARGLADAEQSEQKREEAEADVATMLQDARAQAAEIVAQAQKRANEVVEESKTTARTEGERLIVAARADIEQEVVGAREGLRRQVGAVAMDAARKILGSEVDESRHGAVIDDLASRI